ncbi:biotin holocarboxylase synthetase [Allomyces javanicus]|nr:biotin holocarboxylase synthetase [Allomyces javanicus]
MASIAPNPGSVAAAAAAARAPAPAPMNVLLYADEGTSPASVSQTLATLRALLGGRYDVVQVDARTLRNDPWEPSTALVVIPGGRDLPYLRKLGTDGQARIAAYVRSGGRYLGICAGAYFASQSIEFEVNDPDLCVTGKREMAFFPGMARGAVYPGFQYDSEAGARATTIYAVEKTRPKDLPAALNVYFNGGCFFDLETVPAAHRDAVTVLASYQDSSPLAPSVNAALPAVVECAVGQGRAVLMGPHIEYAPARMAGHPDTALIASLAHDEPHRQRLLAWILGDRLALDVRAPQMPPGVPSRHDLDPATCAPEDAAALHKPIVVASLDTTRFVQALGATRRRAVGGATETTWTVEDDHDAFRIETAPTAAADSAVATYKAAQQGYAWPVAVLGPQLAQSRDDAALFDLSQFQACLQRERGKYRHMPFAMGDHVLWSRVITSTQTVLDQNPAFLAGLPSGTIFVGAHQTLGRGRGRNSWISPPGCLQFSMVVRCSIRPNPKPGSPPYLPPAATVFVQYLMGLAVAAATGPKRAGVRVKWPNDLYARDGAAKVGGILVTSSLLDNVFTLVVGCGLNVANAAPTTSLNALLPEGAPPLTLEQTLAEIAVEFDRKWTEFVGASGFSEALRQEYYAAWLHSGQQVTLAEHEGRAARIVGLDEHGFLKTVAADDPRVVYVLQPDGNSFDMMRGLISKKVQ